jgi:hypothetical protein
MDPLKIILFIAAFAALLVLGRLLSRISDVHAASLPVPAPQPGSAAELSSTALDSRDSRSPAVVGAEIPFPIRLPPVIQHKDGTYNRPHILNYYFAKTDLIRGPEDPDCMFDQLTIEAQDPGTGAEVHYSYTVATPAGLRLAMDQEKLASLYLENAPVVIVPRWDLSLILQTVIDELMKPYDQHGGAQAHG